MASNLLRTVRRWVLGTARPSGRRPIRNHYRPSLEGLEQRWVPATLVVDDNLLCPGALYTTIQDAVDAAAAGDTIHVCEGTYNEKVIVNKTLTLEGEDRLAVVTPPGPGTPIDPSFGFDLQADNIVVHGFTFTGATGSAAGIHTSSLFSGYVIRDNLFRDNTIGLYLGSSGDIESSIRDNDFEENNATGAASGNGIYADQGTVNVRIDHNSFKGHTNSGILFADVDLPQNNITIRHNTSVDDAVFVTLFNADDVKIEHNRISDTNPADNVDQGSKIFVGAFCTDITIRRNDIDGGGYDGIAVRDVRGDGSLPSAPGSTSDVEIVHNHIENVDRDGVSITATAVGVAHVSFNHISDVGNVGIFLGDGTSGNEVSHNHIRGSKLDGISLVNSDNNEIERNHINDNDGDGIHLDAASTGNTLTKNHMHSNALFDAHDESTGAGTEGTANTWDKNHCDTDSPEGLCKHKGKP